MAVSQEGNHQGSALRMEGSNMKGVFELMVMPIKHRLEYIQIFGRGAQVIKHCFDEVTIAMFNCEQKWRVSIEVCVT